MIARNIGHLVAVVLFFAIWQIFYALSGSIGLASPGATLERLRSMSSTADFWRDVAETLRAFTISLLLVLPGGLALGFLLGINKMVGRVVEPVLVNIHSLPKVTLYPLVLLSFGLGLSARVAFGVMHGLIPLCLYTMNAIARMKPVYLRTASAMRLSTYRTMTAVIWPAILPEIMTGVRLAFSLSLLGVLIGEMFASQAGLGHLVMAAMERGDMASTLAVALLLTAFSFLANTSLLAMERAARHERT